MDGINEKLIEQKIFVILKTGRNYTGIVKSCKEDIVNLIDKFGQPVWFSMSEISSMEVQK